MSQLIGAGQDTAQDYGKMYATIEAGAERADAERMAYGAPEGAMGATAYTYELLGDDGESGRNTKRGVAALLLLAAGGAAFLLRRRFV
jgi:putative membrane protein